MSFCVVVHLQQIPECDPYVVAVYGVFCDRFTATAFCDKFDAATGPHEWTEIKPLTTDVPSKEDPRD